MKSSIYWLMVLALLLHACMVNDSDHSDPGKIQFSFNLNSSDPGHERIAAFDLPDEMSLLVSIQKNDGEPVIEYEKIQFFKENDHYVTQPLSLVPGNYVLTDLILADENDDAIYAAPLKGSKLASAVENALDLRFTIAGNSTSILQQDLIYTLNTQAADFGYESFRFKKGKKQTIKVVAGIINDGAFTPTTASAFILKGNDTLKTYFLRPRVNEITFNAIPGNKYTFVVIKDGYARFAKSFTYEELINDRNKKPLKVTLIPALTFIATPGLGESSGVNFDKTVWVEIDGYQGNLTIDWGDGTIENYLVSDWTEKRHNYADRGRYYISVTGDLHLITFFTSQNQGLIRHINFEHVPNITSMWFYYTQGLKKIDLSHNHALNDLRFFNTNIEKIDISAQAEFNNVELGYNIYLTPESLNAIIDDLYTQSVSRNNTAYKFLWLSANDNNDIIGPPSPAAIEKLKALQNYGWEVVPDPDSL